jgi:hypothetical protein
VSGALRAVCDFLVGEDRATALGVLLVVGAAAVAARVGLLDDELLVVVLALAVIGVVALRVAVEALRGRGAR